MKDRQPDHVVLLAGNRDINKMRLLRELTGAPPQIRFRLAWGDADNPVGKLTVDTGHLVKGVLESGELLLYKARPGYRTEQLAITRAALDAPRGARMTQRRFVFGRAAVFFRRGMAFL